MEKWRAATQALRAFTWNDKIEDERDFIEQWLALIRTAFRVDFSFATLITQERKIEAAAPTDPSGSHLVSLFVNAFFEDFSTSRSPTLVEDIDVRWGFRTLAAASLSPTGKGLSGVIVIGGGSRSDFTARELFHFQNTTEELGFALRRSRLRKIFKRNRILVAVAEETDSLGFKEVLANAAARARNHLGTDLCAIRLIDQKQHFWPIALSPDSRGNLEFLLSAQGANITPRLFEKRRTIAVSCHRRNQPSPSPYPVYLGTRLPPKEEKLLGVLEVYSTNSRMFGTEEIVFIEELAQLVSLSLNRSKVGRE